MNKPASTLAVFFEPDALELIHSAWPEQICLAVCLTDGGDCNLLTFRHEELQRIPGRILDVIGAPENELCVVPEIPGLATRALLYSEQQTLIDIIASHPSVLEEAQDYAVNFQFALDEGLDPRNILDPATESVGMESLVERVFDQTAPSLPSFLRSREEKGINAETPAQSLTRRTLRVNAQDNSLILGPNSSKLSAPAFTRQSEVDLFVNADGTRILLPTAAIENDLLSAHEGQTIAVRFPALPREVLKLFRTNTFFVDTSTTGDFLQIAVKDQVPATLGVVEFVSRRERPKPRLPRWTLLAG